MEALKDYWQLTRPRIVAMVLLAMGVAAWTAGEEPPPWLELVHALLGTGLVIVGAVALNQRLERRGDAKMPRTALRPLPSGRLTDRQVTRFGILTSAVGFGYLVCCSAGSLVALAALSWVIYVWTYTPLKSLSVWQTPVGAVAGAMPMLLGAAAADALLRPMGAALFGVVFFWQFPHAMAIAWLYRDQFASADVRLVTVVDPSGRMAGWIAVGGAVALLPASLIPAFLSSGGPAYAAVATLLGIGYLGLAVAMLRRRDDATARWLLRGSIVYLPGLFAAMLW
ncbi:MAG TPA: heme o synthase [Thermoguttaceae bacterium]|nr:heme o synthase [Thermoguttaceae bacterium]